MAHRMNFFNRTLPPQIFIIPALLGFVLCFIAALEFYFLPNAYQSELAERQRHLASMALVLNEVADTEPERALVLFDKFNQNYAADYHFSRTSSDSVSINLSQQTPSFLVELPVDQGTKILSGWVNESALQAELSTQYRKIELVFFLLILSTFVVLGLTQHRIVTGPIRGLVEALNKGTNGDLEFKMPNVHPNSSLAPLISSFRDMRTAVSRQRAALETQIHERTIAESRLRESHQIAQLGAWEWLVKNDRFWCSSSLLDLFEEGSLSPKKLEDFLSHIYPSDRHTVRKFFNDIDPNGEPSSVDCRFTITSGSPRNFQIVARAVLNEHGELFKVLGTCQDITERKNIEVSLKKLSSAITHSGSAVIIIDVLGMIEYVNPKYGEITGFSSDELMGQQPDLLSREFIEDEKYEALWDSILAGEHWRGELQNVRKDGSKYWSVVSISPLYNEFAELTHFVIVSEDVSELKDAHAKMEKLALYDELTGLPNRRLFFKELEKLFEQDVITAPAVVMLLDLDYFKSVNDTQGHSAGDQLLIQVAQRLTSSLSENDIAARLGGDEFTILINSVEDIKQVERIAENILTTIGEPFRINDTEVQISTSLGLACLPKDGKTPDALLKHADLAMYQAKEKGRNQYRFFTESLQNQLQSYVRFSREMPRSLKAREFELYFQPQVDLSNGRVCGFEALIRWNHPELGIVSPADFISIAEETGFIVPMGKWIIEETCAMLAFLEKEKLGHIRIAFNLSQRQFRSSSLLPTIKDGIKNNGIDPTRLEVEITESSLMHDIRQAIEMLKELSSLGVTVAIDDFGIGYSSFSHLKNLPVNIIKIDREFIKDIPEHIDDMEITSAIISMAHRLGKRVIAEGVETETHRAFLKEQNCDMAQGYFYSKPIPKSEVVDLVRKIESAL